MSDGAAKLCYDFNPNREQKRDATYIRSRKHELRTIRHKASLLIQTTSSNLNQSTTMPDIAQMSPKAEFTTDKEPDIPQHSENAGTKIKKTAAEPEEKENRVVEKKEEEGGKPSKADITNLLDTVQPQTPSLNSLLPNTNFTNDQAPTTTTTAYTKTAKQTTQTIQTTLKSTFTNHPYLSTFLLSHLLLSGLPIALFLIGLVVSVSLAASAFTLFAFLILGPVLAVTGFLAVCAWVSFWVGWMGWGVVRGWLYSSSGSGSASGSGEADVPFSPKLGGAIAGSGGRDRDHGDGKERGSSWVSVGDGGGDRVEMENS